MTTRPCPTATCDTAIAPSAVLCDPCWDLLPRGLRHRVWDAWTTWSGSGTTDARAYYDATIRDAAAAVEQARAAVANPGNRAPGGRG